MKIMIRAHDLGVMGAENVKAEITSRSIDGIQLVAYKICDDLKYEIGALTDDVVREIRANFCDGEIALIGAYFNPVHPNEEKIQRGIGVFKDYLSRAVDMGCSVVGSETGSYNGDPWIYHPMNHSDEALDRVVKVFDQLADYAAEYSAFIGMEGAFGHVCHTPERLDEAIKRIGRDNIKIIFDLYNYLDISNYKQAYDILDRGLKVFGDRILLFHIKDFNVSEEKLKQCGVGHGQLDFDIIIKKIYDHNPDAILVLEGTVGEDIDYAVSFLREKINKMTYYSKES